MASEWKDKRPMAPHLQIWRWHPAMLSSILHRACSIICYIGLIKVGLGILFLALTGKLPMEKLIFSPLGAIGLFIFLFTFIFMALAQLRHAVWDTGKMLDPDKNNTFSYIMIVASLILAATMTFLAAGAA